jgi:hypothetical protein
MKTFGHIAYEAYCASLISVAPSLKWEAQTERVRQAWESAAQAVVEETEYAL